MEKLFLRDDRGLERFVESVWNLGAREFEEEAPQSPRKPQKPSSPPEAYQYLQILMLP